MVGTFAIMAGKQFKRVYLKDWREYAKLTQVQLAEMLGVTDITVSRWERGTRDMDTEGLVAIAGVISKVVKAPIEPQDLFRHPNTLSLDSMLRGAPEPLKRQAEAIIKAMREQGGQK